MRYPNVTSLYFATLLHLTPPTEGFLWDDLRKISHGCQTMAKEQNGEEILRKVSSPEQGAPTLQTDKFAIANTQRSHVRVTNHALKGSIHSIHNTFTTQVCIFFFGRATTNHCVVLRQRLRQLRRMVTRSGHRTMLQRCVAPHQSCERRRQHQCLNQ